jgi:hypothetical protein
LLSNASKTLTDFSLDYIFLPNVFNAWAQVEILPLTFISPSMNAADDSHIVNPHYKRLKSIKDSLWDLLADGILQ